MRKKKITPESLKSVTESMLKTAARDQNGDFILGIKNSKYFEAVIAICDMSLSAHMRRICRDGGIARAAKLGAQQRIEIARHAAMARWKKRIHSPGEVEG